MGTPKLNAKGMTIPSEGAYKGILDCFSKTYRGAGLRGLYRGVGMYTTSVFFVSLNLSSQFFI